MFEQFSRVVLIDVYWHFTKELEGESVCLWNSASLLSDSVEPARDCRTFLLNFLRINNYSPKWRSRVVDIYRAAPAR